MTARNPVSNLLLLAATALTWFPAARAEDHAIDTAKSVITVNVHKSGVLSAFGHDHEITAPVASGKVDTSGHHVEVTAKAASLKVADKGISEKDREETQKTMLGSEVLDAARHPDISFRSTSAEPAGAGAWKVSGNLTLHGETRPVTVTVREQQGHYTGTAKFKQTEFGITPVKVAGGTVRVKDEVQIEFSIHLAR